MTGAASGAGATAARTREGRAWRPAARAWRSARRWWWHFGKSEGEKGGKGHFWKT